MIGGSTKLAGVMGWPITHSRSPRLHNFWLSSYNINGAYLPLSVRPSDFKEAIRLLPKLGFVGCNITMPHKEIAIDCMDHVDGVAKKIGAINTVVIGNDGTLTGTNTDAYGFLRALKEAAPKLDLEKGPTILVGAGGAAKAIAVALLETGVSDLIILNRTQKRADFLAESLGENVKVYPWAKRAAILADANLLVNTTTQGMEGMPPLDLALDDLPTEAVVMDIIYTPLLTPLLVAASKRGNTIVGGLDMLLHQACPGFTAWFGFKPVVDKTLRDHIIGDL